MGMAANMVGVALWLIVSLLISHLDSVSCRSPCDIQPNHHHPSLRPPNNVTIVLTKEKQIYGRQSTQTQVNVPASQAWDLYGTIELSRFSVKYLPTVFSGVQVLKGDGGVGTVLLLFFPPGGGFSSYEEEFTKVDNKSRVKESEVIKGGYLNLGFTLFRTRVQTIKICKESCIVRFTVEYRVKEAAAANASLVSLEPLVTIMDIANSYLLKNKKT